MISEKHCVCGLNDIVRILIIRRMKFIFETVLGYVSGDQMGYFEAKKTESKISRLGTFKISLEKPKNLLQTARV